MLDELFNFIEFFSNTIYVPTDYKHDVLCNEGLLFRTKTQFAKARYWCRIYGSSIFNNAISVNKPIIIGPPNINNKRMMLRASSLKISKSESEITPYTRKAPIIIIPHLIHGYFIYARKSIIGIMGFLEKYKYTVAIIPKAMGQPSMMQRLLKEKNFSSEPSEITDENKKVHNVIIGNILRQIGRTMPL